MNTRERFVRTLTGQEVDRVPFMKIFGGTNDTMPSWELEYPGISQCIDKVIGFEGEYRGWQITPVNTYLSQVGAPEILEDNEARKVERQGDGTVIIYSKGDKHGFSHTAEWPVKNIKDWCRIKEKHLQADDPSRFPKDWHNYVKSYRRRDYPLQLTHSGVYGFARLMMGDESLAYAFYDEPEMVHDIMDSYTDMCIGIWSKMAENVEFDLIECWEDMAFNSGALISPALFREFMKPNYLKIKRFAQEHNIGIILVDSDGYIEDLAALMIESGVNCMYPFEVQAGNNARKVLDRHEGLGAVGCLDKNVMDTGKNAIDAEMKRARELIRQGRIIPGPDHFPIKSSFENYRYFMESLKEVVMTTKPEQG